MKPRRLLFLSLLFPFALAAQMNLDTLSQPRTGMSSCVLGNLAFFAGSSGNGSDLVEIYDQTTGSWTTHTMVTRKSYPYCRVLNNKVYIISSQGVYGNPVQDHIIDYYDGNTSSWSTDTVPLALNYYEYQDFDVQVHNDEDLVFLEGTPASGMDPMLIKFNTNTHAWVYDTIPDSLIANMLTIHNDEALWTNDGYLPMQYLVHYDLNAMAVTSLDTIPMNVSMAHIFNADDKTFICGGFLPFSAWTSPTFYIYDHQTGLIDQDYIPMGGNPSIMRYGNQVVFASGSSYSGSYSYHTGQVYFYNLSNDTLYTASMSYARGNYALVAECGKVYLAGGFSYNQNNPITIRDTIDAFDTINYQRTTGELYQPTYNHCGEAINGTLIFAGGVTPAQPATDLVEIFDCQSLGEAEPVSTGNISVYPNPASGEMTVEYNGAYGRYVLYDLPGRKVLSGALSSGRNTIDLGTLAPGLYALSIEGENGKLYSETIAVMR